MQQSLPAMLDIWQKTLSWQPSDRQIELFSQLYEATLEGNQIQNLTRITEPNEFWEKHIWDSLLGIAPFLIADFVPTLPKKSLATVSKTIDIGTGAGFPGLPIAIANPNWTVTMVDSTQKKIAFVNRAIAELQLNNSQAIISRAETLGRHSSHREQYDLALIRAVAQPSVCAEYILPFVKVGGFGVLYRGHWHESDTIALETAVKQLGSEITAIEQTITPLSDSIRNCVYLYKHSPTSNKFPRSVGVPNQQPL
jgi:16S rRNA (guanine527-N7)-methyltransferase